eukprot:scaffold4066_cov417-Prasinococcus_capsulatus_cf.AAC.21
MTRTRSRGGDNVRTRQATARLSAQSSLVLKRARLLDSRSLGPRRKPLPRASSSTGLRCSARAWRARGYFKSFSLFALWVSLGIITRAHVCPTCRRVDRDAHTLASYGKSSSSRSRMPGGHALGVIGDHLRLDH